MYTTMEDLLDRYCHYTMCLGRMCFGYNGKFVDRVLYIQCAGTMENC